MSPVPSEAIALADLERLLAASLGAAGTAPANAASVARALAAAERDGQVGHGVSRLKSYISQVRAGKIDGRATPVATLTRPATLTIDAAHGFAYPALDVAVDRLPALARASGIAAAAVFRSHHAGAVGLVVERLAREGLLAIMTANTPPAMAPWGGRTPLLGTNPLAFATPRSGGEPIVIDLALTEVARGKIVAAANKGEPIPEGWAIDREGAPTTDAKAALDGALLPAGGAKGAALAVMVEVLAAAVTGAHFAAEASSFLDATGPPPATGQLLIAIEAGAFQSASDSLDRIGVLAAMIEAEPGARLPGARRLAMRARAGRDGVVLSREVLAELRALAAG